MGLIASMHQAHYMPWLGYFEKIDRADVFIALDRVQFEKNGYQNRNRIKTPNGALWITVPALTKGRPDQALGDVLIDTKSGWRSKHLKSIAANYRKAPHFDRYYPLLENFLMQRDWENLVELNIALMRLFMEQLGIDTPVKFESEIGAPGARTERIVNICRAVGASTYLSGAGAKVYLDPAEFEAAGIELLFQEFKTPEYPQLYGDFEPYMGVIDVLMNCGDESLGIIRRGGK